MTDKFIIFRRTLSESANAGVNTFDRVDVLAGVPLTTGNAGVTLPGLALAQENGRSPFLIRAAAGGGGLAIPGGTSFRLPPFALEPDRRGRRSYSRTSARIAGTGSYRSAVSPRTNNGM